MKLSSEQALEILGRVASINERIRLFLNNCARDGIYDDIIDIMLVLSDTYFIDPITANVEITLNLEEGVREIIEQIAKQEETNYSSACQLDVSEILEDIVKLNRDIKRQNRQ